MGRRLRLETAEIERVKEMAGDFSAVTTPYVPGHQVDRVVGLTSARWCAVAASDIR